MLLNRLNEKSSLKEVLKMSDTQNDEDARTIFVRGIAEEVDQEILFELFQNAGPLVKVNIPIDKETKRKKNFCFVQFQHRESVKYAMELFRDIKLFGNRLTMQNRTAGGGNRGPQRDQNQGTPSHQHNQAQRTMSAPMPIGGPPIGQFNPLYGHQGGMVQNPYNNEMLVAQQQMMMQQQMNYNRQHSDNSQDYRLQNPYPEYQQQQNQQQDRRHHDDRSRNNQDQQNFDRRQQGHNREDRSRPAFDRQHSQGNDFRDRSHDRRSYDNRNNSNQHGGNHDRRRY